MSRDIVTTVRIPKEDNKCIEQLVEKGRFINRSDFLRHAVKKLLESERKGG